MKNLFILLVILLISKPLFAQKELITLDEHNKYIYYQLIDMPGITADTLFKRCLIGLKKKPDFKPETTGQVITAKAKMMLYSNQSYVKHEDGELTYTLYVEFKDTRYRFWLTDFSFTPYQRNRYGVYARVPGGATSLEDLKAKLDSKIMDNYLEQIAKFGKETGEDTKKCVAEPVKKSVEPVKIDTRKW